jgi:hypothetical protein
MVWMPARSSTTTLVMLFFLLPFDTFTIVLVEMGNEEKEWIDGRNNC